MIELGIKTPPADTASAVTSKYTEAYNLNVRICINAQMAQQNLYEVCKGLKEMRRLNREHDEWSAKIQDEHIKDVQRIHAENREKMDKLRAEYEEKLAAAQAADAQAPDSKEIFKAYLANAIDAVKRMTGFLAAHPNDACKSQAVRFFEAAMKEVQA